MIEEFFRTARLIFRPFAQDDLDAFATILSDPDVMRFVDKGLPASRDVAALWITRSRQNVEKFGYGTGAVLERASGRFIGWAGIARPQSAPEEIVYGFAKAAWGKGYGTEIAEGLIRFSFDRLNLPELRATAYPENLGSHRILRKHGFEHVASHDDGVMVFMLPRARRSILAASRLISESGTML